MVDLTAKLVLRAQAEGQSEIRAMAAETAELAAAMREVREAAKSGGQVSASTIKELGGYANFEQAFRQAQKELEGGKTPGSGEAAAKEAAAWKLSAKQRAQAELGAAIEAAKDFKLIERADLQAETSVRREAEQTLKLRMGLWAQERREAEETAAAEARAAEQAARAQERAAREAARAEVQAQREMRREAEQTLAFNMRMWRQRQREMAPPPETRGRHGRGVLGELGMAAEYTLVYGAINKVLEGVGALARAPFDIAKMTLGVAEGARSVEELSKSTRMATDDIQGLQAAFELKGLDPDKLPQMLLFMAKSEVAAARGIKTNAAAFKALGVSVLDSQHRLKPMTELLYETTDALHKLGGGPKADAISMMIFGRGVKDLLPIIQGGSAALKEMSAQAKDMHFTLSPDEIGAAEKAAEDWSRLKLQMIGFRNDIAGAAMPILTGLLGDASEYLKSHRAEIVKDIKDTFAELKADLPVILSGMREFADLILKIAGAASGVAAITRMGADLSIAGSGNLPAGARMASLKDLQDTATRFILNQAQNLANGWRAADAQAGAKAGAAAATPPSGQVHITVSADKGSKVTGVTTKGSGLRTDLGFVGVTY